MDTLNLLGIATTDLFKELISPGDIESSVSFNITCKDTCHIKFKCYHEMKIVGTLITIIKGVVRTAVILTTCYAYNTSEVTCERAKEQTIIEFTKSLLLLISEHSIKEIYEKGIE